jgi:hypothetical protein
MSIRPISDYGLTPWTDLEEGMNIDRRRLLAGTAGMALAGLFGPGDAGPWHPLTRSLLDRARRVKSASRPTDTARIERVIRHLADASGRSDAPVIKWLPDPFAAHDLLSSHGLDELLRMGMAGFWRRRASSGPFDDRSLDLSFVLRGVVADIVGVEHHDRALMAPKLLAKSRAIAEGASAKAIFEARAVSAQIGWLETCLPVAAAQAVADIELFLSAGSAETDEPVYHQLKVFEAYELGLLATWETPDALICIPTSARAASPLPA